MSEVQSIINDFNKDRDIVAAASRIRQLGLAMIGTAQSQKIHHTQPYLSSFDLDLGEWVVTHGKEDTARFLSVSGIGRAAVMFGIFGDRNQPGQRTRMGDNLVSGPGPHFGFAPNPNAPERCSVHATQEAIDTVRTRGASHTGAIDIVEGEFYFTQARAWSGLISLYHARTVGTLDITGKDLPADIIAIDYAHYLDQSQEEKPQNS